MWGFIILRHVNSVETGKYWVECLKQIRTFYPKSKVMIIDDYSNRQFLSGLNDEHAFIVDSEYKGRGELLPLHYYYQQPFCDQAVILHDSVFIKHELDVGDEDVSFLWNFHHTFNNHQEEAGIIDKLDNKDILHATHGNREKWFGCFGTMSVIKHSFLKKIYERHDLSRLVDCITHREARSNLERVYAVICFSNTDKIRVLFGSIFGYNVGYTFDAYKREEMVRPIIKVWTGR